MSAETLDRGDLANLLAGLTKQAGGELRINLLSIPEVAGKLHIFQENTEMVLRLIDPDAPVEGAHYWVRRIDRRHQWDSCLFEDGSWYSAGIPDPVQVAEIGPRIESPTADAVIKPIAADTTAIASGGGIQFPRNFIRLAIHADSETTSMQRPEYTAEDAADDGRTHGQRQLAAANANIVGRLRDQFAADAMLAERAK